MVDKPARNAAPVFSDGVFVTGGADPAQMVSTGLIKAFLDEAFKHGDAICAVEAAAQTVKAAQLPQVATGGSPKLGVLTGDDVAAESIEALMTPRFHNRDSHAVAA